MILYNKVNQTFKKDMRLPNILFYIYPGIALSLFMSFFSNKFYETYFCLRIVKDLLFFCLIKFAFEIICVKRYKRMEVKL